MYRCVPTQRIDCKVNTTLSTQHQIVESLHRVQKNQFYLVYYIVLYNVHNLYCVYDVVIVMECCMNVYVKLYIHNIMYIYIYVCCMYYVQCIPQCVMYTVVRVNYKQGQGYIHYNIMQYINKYNRMICYFSKQAGVHYKTLCKLNS